MEGEVEAERRALIEKLLGDIVDTSVPDNLVLADLIRETVNNEVRVGNTANIDLVELRNDGIRLSKDTSDGELVGVGIQDFPLRSDGIDVISVGNGENESNKEEKLHN